MCTPLYNPYAHQHCCMYARQNGGSLSRDSLCKLSGFFVSFLYKPKLCTYHYPPETSPLSKTENTATQEKIKPGQERVHAVGQATTNPPLYIRCHHKDGNHKQNFSHEQFSGKHSPQLHYQYEKAVC